MKQRILAVLLCLTCILGGVAMGSRATADEDICAPLHLPIVMYHHVSDNETLLGAYVITPQELEADLRWLQENNYTSITAQELLDWYYGDFTMPEKPCMITFDDGFESTSVVAAPLLEQYGFRGIVAVMGSVTEQYTQTPDHNLQYSHMDWPTVAATSHGKVLEVQCHTWDMHKLADRRGCSQMEGESREAYFSALQNDIKRFLENCQANNVQLTPMIAYPYGASNEITCQIVQELGFRGAFTCEERINQLSRDNPAALFHLGRYNRPHGIDSQSFFHVWEKND